MKYSAAFLSVKSWLALIWAILLTTAAASYSYKNRELKVRTTAYTHTESDHREYRNKSALGTTLKYSQTYTSAASDWSRYPVGTEFRIKGLNRHFVIDDYGRALVGKDTIDLYFPSKSEMNRWGVKNVDIIITKYGDFEKSRKILSQRVHYEHCLEMLTGINANFREGEPESYEAVPEVPTEINPELMASASVPQKDWNKPAPGILPDPKQPATIAATNWGFTPPKTVDLRFEVPATTMLAVAIKPYTPIRKIRHFRPILSKP
jgi:3D (Asp-Asp-Asp) domain-containing protein